MGPRPQLMKKSNEKKAAAKARNATTTNTSQKLLDTHRALSLCLNELHVAHYMHERFNTFYREHMARFGLLQGENAREREAKLMRQFREAALFYEKRITVQTARMQQLYTTVNALSA